MGAVNPLTAIGPRSRVMQIVPPRDMMRPALVHEEDEHDLVSKPLSAPTGPGGAKGFRNVAGSQILVPHVTNVYLGPFWGDQAFVEGFSKAVVENGYLDPLRELHYGTGSGRYLAHVNGPTLKAKTTLTDDDARALLVKMIDAGTLRPDEHSLFMLILPDGVASTFGDGDRSCTTFCGYHDAVRHGGLDVAYAVMPAPLCKACGGQLEDFTAVYAHELAEAVTDTVPGEGWVADDGSENGDLEAWILIPWGPPSDPKRYIVQGYYTNERGNTVGAWRDVVTQAKAAFAASSAIAATAARPDLTPELAQQIVVHDTPRPHKFGGDPDQQLLELGVIDDVQAGLHAARIQKSLSDINWRIKRSDIDTGPATSVGDCTNSVLANAI
jgi:hypothetical protein